MPLLQPKARLPLAFVGGVLALLSHGDPASAQLALPAKADIPADYSTTLCRDIETAKRMLDFIEVKPSPNNHTINIDRFFEGLSATGCVQSPDDLDGPVTITRVIARKTIALATNDESHIVYEGRTASGQTIVGVLDETGNDKAPRTPLERWLTAYTSDGSLTIEAPDDDMAPQAYRCPSVAAARTAVTAIAEPASVSDATKNRAFEAARAKQGCTTAAGRFVVTSVHEERVIACGEECAAVWTALAVTDESGKAVGLIFDGGLM